MTIRRRRYTKDETRITTRITTAQKKRIEKEFGGHINQFLRVMLDRHEGLCPYCATPIPTDDTYIVHYPEVEKVSDEKIEKELILRSEIKQIHYAIKKMAKDGFSEVIEERMKAFNYNLDRTMRGLMATQQERAEKAMSKQIERIKWGIDNSLKIATNRIGKKFVSYGKSIGVALDKDQIESFEKEISEIFENAIDNE